MRIILSNVILPVDAFTRNIYPFEANKNPPYALLLILKRNRDTVPLTRFQDQIFTQHSKHGTLQVFLLPRIIRYIFVTALTMDQGLLDEHKSKHDRIVLNYVQHFLVFSILERDRVWIYFHRENFNAKYSKFYLTFIRYIYSRDIASKFHDTLPTFRLESGNRCTKSPIHCPKVYKRFARKFHRSYFSKDHRANLR